MAVLPDGQILSGGSFWAPNGGPYNGSVRSNADGSVDPDFNADGSGINTDDDRTEVAAVAVLPGGCF